MAEANELKVHSAPLADALINLLVPLVEEAVRRVHQPVEGGHTLVPKLVSVKQASEVLGTNPDAIRRLIRVGELTGYPFPDEISDLHVDYASINDLLARRKEEHHSTHGHLRLAKTGTHGGKGGRR